MRDGLISLCAALIKNQPADMPAINLVELGSYCGESSAIFLEHLPVGILYCVDAWSETNKYRPAEIGAAETIFDAFRRKNPAVVKYKATTDVFFKRAAKLALNKVCRIDLIYIDADHRYEGVKHDIAHSLKLIRPGGAIGGHDYNQKKFPGVVKAVNEAFGKPDLTFEDTSWLKFL